MREHVCKLSGKFSDVELIQLASVDDPKRGDHP
jgi:hypothetical protein